MNHQNQIDSKDFCPSKKKLDERERPGIGPRRKKEAEAEDITCAQESSYTDIFIKIPTLSPLEQIREHCRLHCGGSAFYVFLCDSIECPLWYFRFGVKPKTLIETKGESFAALVNKNNFKE